MKNFFSVCIIVLNFCGTLSAHANDYDDDTMKLITVHSAFEKCFFPAIRAKTSFIAPSWNTSMDVYHMERVDLDQILNNCVAPKLRAAGYSIPGWSYEDLKRLSRPCRASSSVDAAEFNKCVDETTMSGMAAEVSINK